MQHTLSIVWINGVRLWSFSFEKFFSAPSANAWSIIGTLRCRAPSYKYIFTFHINGELSLKNQKIRNFKKKTLFQFLPDVVSLSDDDVVVNRFKNSNLRLLVFKGGVISSSFSFPILSVEREFFIIDHRLILRVDERSGLEDGNGRKNIFWTYFASI